MNKRNRVMEIFYRFMSGEHMAVKDLAAEYEVSEKSIQRDISEIKNFMAEYGYSVGREEVKFDRSSQKMYFEAEKFLTNGEMLAITKILIATRTLPQDKMNQLVEKLEGFASTKDKKRLKELVKDGSGAAAGDEKIDAISGSTVTSKAVLRLSLIHI